MFKRVIFEDWTTIVPIISFAVTLLIFISFFIRTIMMDKATVNRTAQLALQADETNQSEPTND